MARNSLTLEAPALRMSGLGISRARGTSPLIRERIGPRGIRREGTLPDPHGHLGRFGGSGYARGRGAQRECLGGRTIPGEARHHRHVDRASHAGWPAGLAGHLDQRHDHAARAAARAGDRAFLTEQEAASLEKADRPSGATTGDAQARARATSAATTSSGSTRARRSCPPGRPRSSSIRPMAASRSGRRPKRGATTTLTRSTDSYEFMSVWDRCITRGMPGLDVSGRLQQRVPDRPDARLRRHRTPR